MTNAIIEILEINPEQAKEALETKFPEQRPLRPLHVKRLASEMSLGLFRLSADAILFIRGRLANGQHRLSAVVESGIASKFLVLRTDDEEIYKITDCGMKRSVGDGLSLSDIKFYNQVPLIANWVLLYESGRITIRGQGGGNARQKLGITRSRCIEYCIANKEILSAAAEFVVPIHRETRLLPLGIAGALYVIGERRGKPEQTKEFLKAVFVSGGENSAGDLRNRLVLNKGARKRPANAYWFGVALRALKSYLNGTRPSVLKWEDGQEIPEI